jgi:hypothetical protein
MAKVYIENDAVTVEANGVKKHYATFVAAAEALGLEGYGEAEAMMEAIEATGEYEA